MDFDFCFAEEKTTLCTEKLLIKINTQHIIFVGLAFKKICQTKQLYLWYILLEITKELFFLQLYSFSYLEFIVL